jgi:hypothetical protein
MVIRYPVKVVICERKLYIDGTFRTAPRNFDQVYIINAIHHGTCKLSLFNFKDLKTQILLKLMNFFHCNRFTGGVCTTS